MPHYYLNVCNMDVQARDEEGQELANLEAARWEAIASIRSILSHELAEGRLDLRGEIRIENARRDVVRVVPYADALEIMI
jgi:hypothetical protein